MLDTLQTSNTVSALITTRVIIQMLNVIICLSISVSVVIVDGRIGI